jgi:hypothetical protein
MNWNDLEAVVRAQNARPIKEKELTLGERVAWITRVRNAAETVSAVHCHYENRQTFCRLAVPPTAQHLPLLPGLLICRRCEAMARRAVHYARIAGVELKASA